MNIEGGQIRQALFKLFEVKKCLFCIFQMLSSVSTITAVAGVNLKVLFRKKRKFKNKKPHTCEERGALLTISYWHLLMNLKNNYLSKKSHTCEGGGTPQNFCLAFNW